MLNKQTKIAVTTNKKGTKKKSQNKRKNYDRGNNNIHVQLEKKKENTIQDGNRQIHVLHTIM